MAAQVSPSMAQILRYADWGWCVVPLHTPTEQGCSCRRPTCNDIGKHPRITDWPSQATTDLAVIGRWWKQWPSANVGIATGPHLYVLDVDGDQGRETLARLEAQHGTLPETPRGLTGGGGEHYLFSLPAGLTLGNTVRFAPGLDTRGQGGQIVAPPSQHASGRAYTWDAGAHPNDVDVTEMPRWLVTLIQQADTKSHGPLGAVGEMIPEGSRDDTLFKHGSRLRSFGYNEAEILALLHAMNETRCQPPLEDQQVRDKVKQVLGYQAGAFEHSSPDTTPPVFSPQTLTALLEENLPPLREIVKGFIHEGLWLFGGKSKRGKSWLMLDTSMAIACGRSVFNHFETIETPVLYLALEDSKRRIKTRALAIEPHITARDRLHFAYDFPRLGQGASEMLKDAVATYGYGLIIIDVLAHIRKLAPVKGQATGESYQEIYEELRAMQLLAKEKHIAIVLVDHLRKQTADDIFDEIQGSVAKQGAADALMVLERKPNENEAFLHIRSKEVEDRIHALRFAETHFTYLGSGDQYALEKDKRAILDELRTEKDGMTIQEILRSSGAGDGDAAYHRYRRVLQSLESDDFVKVLHGRRPLRYVVTLRGVSPDDGPAADGETV